MSHSQNSEQAGRNALLEPGQELRREIDFDLAFLIALPGITGLSAVWLDHGRFMLALQLMAVMLFWEILLFKDRRLYGLNGLRILSFPSLMFLSYSALIAIPSIYIVSVKELSVRWDFWYAVLSFYIFMPLGFILGNSLWPVETKKLDRLYVSGFQKGEMDRKLYEFLVLLFLFSLLIMADYLLRVPVIPLFELISNPQAYLEAFYLREESRKLLQVSIFERYLFSWLIELFFPLGIAGSAFLAFAYRQKKYIRLFAAFFGLGLFNNSLTIAKAPTAALFLILLSFLFLKQQKLSLRFLLGSILTIFAFPFFVVYFVSIPEIRYLDNLIINGILYRVFVVPAEVLYQFFRVFPLYSDFLGGRSSNIFAWLHPEGGFDTANYVAQIWWRDPFTTGLGNAVYIGNFWADFGWTGVALSTVILALLGHYLYYKILRLSDYRKSSMFYMFVASTVPLFTFYFISVSYTVYLLTKGIVIIFALLFLFKYLRLKSETPGSGAL